MQGVIIITLLFLSIASQRPGNVLFPYVATPYADPRIRPDVPQVRVVKVVCYHAFTIAGYLATVGPGSAVGPVCHRPGSLRSARLSYSGPRLRPALVVFPCQNTRYAAPPELKFSDPFPRGPFPEFRSGGVLTGEK